MSSLRRLKEDDSATLERRLVSSDPNRPMPDASRQALRTWAAGLSGDGNGTSPPSGGTARWKAVKWLLAIAGTTCAVFAVARWESRESSHEPQGANVPLEVVSATPSVAVAPPPVSIQPSDLSAPLEGLPQRAPARGTPAKTVGAASAPPPAEVDTKAPAVAKKATLADEMKWLDAARAHLRAGRSQESLSTLDEYQEQFPQGALKDEAEVMRINALVKLGDRASATQRGRDFLSRHHDDLYTARVRSLLDSLPQDGVGQ